MTAPTRIIGSYLSPYVRKVLVCLHLKGVPYEVDPIVPFYGNDEFTRLSPVRRVPVLVDERGSLCDSTVICEYLDERYPGPPLLPQDPYQRGQARWLEEFADSRMGQVFVWHLYNQLVIRRFVWGEPPDDAMLRKAREEEIPQIMDYLEGVLPAQGFLYGGGMSLADVSVASFFRNAAFARHTFDAARWPRTVAFVERALAQPAFVQLRAFEEMLLRTPIAKHRDALREAGAPVSAHTVFDATPRRGMLQLALGAGLGGLIGAAGLGVPRRARSQTAEAGGVAPSALAGSAAAPAAPERVSLDGYVIPPDLLVKFPQASLGPVAAGLSGWWKSINVPAIFELEILLIFEEFKSAREVRLVVAIKARRGRPGRTERVIATIDGSTVTFIRNSDSRAVVTLVPEGLLKGKVVVSPRFPAVPATFQRVQP